MCSPMLPQEPKQSTRLYTKHVTTLTMLALTLNFMHALQRTHTIESFEKVTSLLRSVDHHTLVIFDVDYTLTAPTDTYQQRWWFPTTAEGKAFMKEINEYINSQGCPMQHYKNMQARQKIATTDQPIEPPIVSLITELQQRSVKVMALTKLHTGSMGNQIIPSLPQWRFEKLQSVGIDFRHGFNFEELQFMHLRSITGHHPMFYKGILMTDMFSKGKVLGAFLDTINWEPSQVIFFDDQPKFVRSVEKEMIKRAIPFQGFIYKGINNMPKVLDRDILAKQLEYFKKYNHLLSDDDARRMLKK
jgi:hypothetical protein